MAKRKIQEVQEAQEPDSSEEETGDPESESYGRSISSEKPTAPLLDDIEKGTGCPVEDISKILIYRVPESDGSNVKLVHTLTLFGKDIMWTPDQLFAVKGGGVFDAMAYGFPERGTGRIIARRRLRSDMPAKSAGQGPGQMPGFGAPGGMPIFETEGRMIGIPDLKPESQMLFAFMQATLAMQASIAQNHEERMANIAMAALGRPTSGADQDMLKFLMTMLADQRKDAGQSREEAMKAAQEKWKLEIEKAKLGIRDNPGLLEKLQESVLTEDNVGMLLKMLTMFAGGAGQLGPGAAAAAGVPGAVGAPTAG